MTRQNPIIRSIEIVAIMMLAVSLAGCAPSQKAATQASTRTYAFWPPAPDEPRVQFLVAYNSSSDIKAKRSGFDQLVLGSQANDALAIGKPYGLRMWNGRIYVCDVRGKGITVLDIRKQQTRVMGAVGSGTVNRAVDLAISADGVKYVVDPTQRAIMVFDADERFVSMFPLRDGNPVGVAVAGDRLYVTDFKLQHVKVLNRHNGQQLSIIGGPGGEDGQFIGPLSVAVDPAGNIFVSDVIKSRIQKFSPDGKLLLAFGETGNRPGLFVRPKHLGVSPDGIVHVVDAAFNNVQIFDDAGHVLMFYGSPGSHPGAMNLPAGLAIHEGDLELFESYVHPAFQAQRLVLVTNQFGNQKVSIYAVGGLKPGKTLADVSPARAAVIEAAGIQSQSQVSAASTNGAEGNNEQPKAELDKARQ